MDETDDASGGPAPPGEPGGPESAGVGIAPGAEDTPVLTLERVAEDLDAVDAALARLDSGAYGRCVTCDAPIDDAVLAARPTATSCSEHTESS